jgi:hypothetical protein
VLFDLTDELVSFFLRHLSATDHVLDEIPGALDHKAGEPGSRVDYIFHGGGHFASGFEAYLMCLCSHFGDGVLDVRAAVAGASFWRYRRSIGRTRGSWLGRFVVLSHHTLLILTVVKLWYLLG